MRNNDIAVAIQKQAKILHSCARADAQWISTCFGQKPLFNHRFCTEDNVAHKTKFIH